jgi:hypothetical protein
MSRWTNVRPRFVINWVVDYSTYEAAVEENKSLGERALRAEAAERDLRETVGELLALMPHVYDVRKIDWPLTVSSAVGNARKPR